MEKTVNLLMSYQGRDKIIRTTGYISMFLAGSTKGQSAEKLATIAKQMSACRVVLRLFDDLPMLAMSTRYGLGKNEKDSVARWLSVIGNLAGQIFFPIEHIAWLADNKIINIQSKNWVTASITMWLISLVTGILKSIRVVRRVQSERAKLRKRRKLESPDKNDSAEASFQDEMRDLAALQRIEVLNIIKNASDLMNAVNWMPQGFLWSGSFTTRQSGLFGAISSAIGLYQLASK